MIFPFLEGYKVSQPYGVIDSSYKAGYHSGIDLVSTGDKTIRAVQPGRVIRSRVSDGWGEYVTIQQDDGLFAVYAHMVEGSRVPEVGSRIEEGGVLGLEGSTGNSTGEHLHLEIVKKYWDPTTSIDVAEYLGVENKKGTYTQGKKKTPTTANLESLEGMNYKAVGVAIVGAMLGVGLFGKK